MAFKSTTKRLRFQFPLKFLIVLPVLVPIYFSFGPSTRTKGITDVKKRLGGDYTYMRTLAPLLIENRKITGEFRSSNNMPTFVRRTEYFFWFHGIVVRIPYSREELKAVPNGRMNGWPSEWNPEPGY